MGQFRPTVQSRKWLIPLDLGVYALGFLISSVTTFALVAAWVGAPVASILESEHRLVLLLGTVLLLLVIDLYRVRQGVGCSMGLRRQTPRHLGFHPFGPFLWGLDTGLPWTTYRSTPLPFIGLAAVALGFANPWVGLAYAGGFLGSLVTACAWPRSGTRIAVQQQDPTRDESAQIMQAIQASAGPAWVMSLLLGGGFLLLLAANLV